MYSKEKLQGFQEGVLSLCLRAIDGQMFIELCVLLSLVCVSYTQLLYFCITVVLLFFF